MTKGFQTAFQTVFGLTADPIHKGHEQVIINSVEFLRNQGSQVEKFVLVPVYKPNLIANKKAPTANFSQRYEMCQKVARRLSKQLRVEVVVSDVERRLSQRSGRSNYSIDTLAELQLPQALFVVSADHFHGRWPKFRKWYRWQDLVAGTGLLINRRPGNKINLSFIEELKTLNPNIFVVESQISVNTSSTFIRGNFANHLNSPDMSEHLSADVIEFIKAHQLYRAAKLN